MKKEIKINLWDFVDIDEVNEALDSNIKKGIAEDIAYNCKKINKNGDIILDCDYVLG